MSEEKVSIIYDGDCPFCSRYTDLLELKDSVGDLSLIDARQAPSIVQEMTQRGFDLNEGMVLQMGETYYHGADAVHAIALLSSPVTFFNKLNYWLFKHKTLSNLLYPFMREFRNATLWLMNRKKI